MYINEETLLKINRSIYNKRVCSVEIVNKIKFDCFFLTNTYFGYKFLGKFKINRSIYKKSGLLSATNKQYQVRLLFLQIHILITSFWDNEEIHCTKVPS